MLSPLVTYWSTLINLIIQNYFLEPSCTCILRHKDFDLYLPNDLQKQFIHIKEDTLAASFEHNVYNFSAKELDMKKKGLYFDDLIEKLTVVIEYSHCESFIAFQDDIPKFVRAYRNASIYSLWRSKHNRFLFAYSKRQQQHNYFDDYFFIDQPRILIVEAENLNSKQFELKTNRFVGSVAAHPEALYLLDRYDAISNTFLLHSNLYPDKVKDLQGREIFISCFDYKPFTVVDYDLQPQIHDNAADNPRHSVLVDGTEVRILYAFCELYNCTVQADTTEKVDWGLMYDNATGSGLVALLLEGKSQLAVGAMYSWYSPYMYLDPTTFLGRSGVTCLVPAPTRLTSWTLPLKPFQFTLWLGVAACLLLEIVSLLVTRRLELPENRLTAWRSWRESFQFGYITTFKLFISQGSNYVVKSNSVRMVLFSCYMIDIIITSIYGGGLSSILTLPILGEAADSVERLEKFGIPWTATSSDWVEAIKRVTDDRVIESLYKNYVVNKVEDLRELAKTENMGFIVERLSFGHIGNVDFTTPEALSRLKLMLDDIYFQFTVGFVPRNWAMLEKFDALIYAWHSSGLDQFWEWKMAAEYMNEHEQEQIQASMISNPDSGPVKLDMANFAGLIVLWIIGIIVSILGFGLELAYYKYTNGSHIGE